MNGYDFNSFFSHLCSQDHYKQSSFRFRLDTFNYTRSLEEQTAIIESFSYMGFEGPVQLRNAEQLFVVHELWTVEHPRKLLKIYLGRYVRSLFTISFNFSRFPKAVAT